MGEHGGSGRSGDSERGSSAGRTLAVVVLTVAVVGGVVALGSDGSPQDGIKRAVGMGSERPLPAVDPPEAGGAYEFMQTTDDDEPIGFDPCTPVEVRINPQNAPDRSEAVVETAVARLSEASGVALNLGDDTDDRPTLGAVGDLESRDAEAPSGGPEIVLTWSRPKETDALTGRTVGVGGSTAYAVGDARPYYLRGAVALDYRPLREALLRSDGPRRVTAVVMHELGHALGLDHVDSPDELMNARSLGRLELGTGDRTGLAMLGSIPCVPQE